MVANSILMNIICLFPHKFNYPVTITPENADFYYRWGISLIRSLELADNTVLLLVIIMMIGAALETIRSQTVVLVMICSAIIPLACLIVFMCRMKFKRD
jgi:hypothetical protein